MMKYFSSHLSQHMPEAISTILALLMWGGMFTWMVKSGRQISQWNVFFKPRAMKAFCSFSVNKFVIISLLKLWKYTVYSSLQRDAPMGWVLHILSANIPSRPCLKKPLQNSQRHAPARPEPVRSQTHLNHKIAY